MALIHGLYHSVRNAARELRLRKQPVSIETVTLSFLLIVCSTFMLVPLGVGEGPSAPHRPRRSLMASRLAVSGAL